MHLLLADLIDEIIITQTCIHSRKGKINLVMIEEMKTFQRINMVMSFLAYTRSRTDELT